MRVYAVAGLIVIGMTLAACTNDEGATNAPSTPTPVYAVAAVDTQDANCQPPGVPGNCWLPLYPQPKIIRDTAINENQECRNTSKDQRTCWPQPADEVVLTCRTTGADGDTWYGVIVWNDYVHNPPRQARSTAAATPTPSGTGEEQVVGYANSRFLNVKRGDPSALAACAK